MAHRKKFSPAKNEIISNKIWGIPTSELRYSTKIIVANYSI